MWISQYFAKWTLALMVCALSIHAIAQPPASTKLDKPALDALVRGAEKAHSSALVVMQDGELVGEWTFGKPSKRIESMSATKSVVSMAIGRLIDTGKIKSLDQPVYEFYPEWNQGTKRDITIRHLLNHTSGVQTLARTTDIYQAPNFVQLTLAAEITNKPGTVFLYNNKAVNLLAGIVETASGKKMDEFVRDEFFAPLDISDFVWIKDKAGNPHGMAGLRIHARDLAKLGALMANGGKWNGKQILSPEWIAQSAAQGSPLEPTCGLLWWRTFDRQTFIIDEASAERVAKAGGSPELVERIKKLAGRYESVPARQQAIRAVFPGTELTENMRALKTDPLWRTEYGTLIGFSAIGYLGQKMYVIPAQKLVVVRMIEGSKDYNDATDGFDEMWELVKALIR